MRNAKKTLSLMMIAIFTTFIVLSGIPAGAAVTKAQATATVKAATAAVVKAEASVKATGFNTNAAKKLTATAAVATAGVKKLGTAYNPTYLKLVARYQAVNKKIAAVIAALNKVYTDAEKAVTAAEKATDGDLVDLVGDEVALANAQGAVTSALEFIVMLDQNSASYKGLMARIDAANNLIVKAMDEIAANQAAADKEAADKLAAEKAAKAEADAIAAAETAVKAVEVATDAAIALDLGKVAATKVAAVKTPEKVAEFTTRLKAVADKFTPATIASVSAVDGTITVNFDKKPLTTVAAVDFTITKTVTTVGAVTTTVVPTAVTVVSDTAVTFTVPAVAVSTTDQSVVYSVQYTTGTAVAAAAYTVAKIPALGIKTVSAINLLQIQVVFNKAVDKTLAETDGNYTLTSGSVADVVLAADRVTATINLTAPAAQGTTIGITIAGVRSEDLTELAATTNTSVTFNDVTAPSITSLTVTANTIVKVYLSEPVAGLSAADFTLNGKVLGVYGGASCVATTAQAAGSGVYPVNQRYTLTFNTSLPAGDYTLAYTGASAHYDAAGFLLPATSNTFSVATVTGAPVGTVTATKASTLNGTVTVTFDRVMMASTLVGANFMLDVTANTASAASISADGKSVTLTYAAGVASGAHVLLIAPGVKDAYGNVVTTSTSNIRVAFSAVADTTAMKVSSVTGTSETVVTVQFDESVDSITGNNSANYAIYDATGTKVAPITGRTLSPVVTNDAYGVPTKVVITLGAKLSGGTFNLTMSNLKDTASNVMATTTSSFSITDLTAPLFQDKDSSTGAMEAAVFNNTTHQEEVFFTEPMQVSGAYSVLDKGNWLFNGAAVPTNVTLAAGASNQSVIFTFPSTTVLAVTDHYSLVIGKDTTGNLAQNLMTAANGAVSITGVDRPYVVYSTVKAYAGTSSNDYVTFDVSDYLATFAASDFTVNGTAPTTGTLVGKTVTLYFADGFLGTGSETYTLAKPGVACANANGGLLTLTNPTTPVHTAGTVYDAIVPHITAVSKVGNTLLVTFNEDLDMKFVGTFYTDFLVDNSGATIVPTWTEASGTKTVILHFSSSVTLASSNVVVYPATSVSKVMDASDNTWLPSTTETYGITAPATATLSAAATTAVAAYVALPITTDGEIATAVANGGAAATAAIATAVAAGATDTWTATVTAKTATITATNAAKTAVLAYEALALTTVGEVATAVTNAGTAATTAIAAVGVDATYATAATARVTAKTTAVNAEKAKVTALTTAITAAQTALNAKTVDNTATPVAGTITTANKTAFQTVIDNATTAAAAGATTIATVVTTTTTLNAGPTLN